MAKKSKKFWLKILLLTLVVGLLTFNYWPVHEKIIISPQTTVIDGPLNPDGTVNYVAYLDAKYAEGVTPDNNAAPLLIKAFGADLLKDTIRDQALSKLGLSDSDLNKGKHFVGWEDRAFKTPPTALGGTRVEDKALEDVCNAILDGKTKGDPDLEAWLVENADALQLVCEACMKPRFYVPLASKYNPPQVIDAMLAVRPSTFNAFGEALCARALLRLGRGDFDCGWADVMAVHRLARLADQYPAPLSRTVAPLVEIADSRVSRYALTRATFPVGNLPSVFNDLESLCPISSAAETLNRTERFVALDATMMFSRGIDPLPSMISATVPSGPLDYNEMLRRSNVWYDYVVDLLQAPYFDSDRKRVLADRVRVIDDELTKTNWIPLSIETRGGRATREAFTRFMCFLLERMGTQSRNRYGHDEARMGLEVEKTAAALAIYKARHGRFPARLKDLSPELLKEIPKDVFSPNGELVYRDNDGAYILYSIGKNLKDDDGVSDDKHKDDIVAKVGDVDTGTSLPTSQPRH